MHILGVEKTTCTYIIYFFSESYLAIRTGNKSNNYNIELDEIMYIDGNYTRDVTDANRASVSSTNDHHRRRSQ